MQLRNIKKSVTFLFALLKFSRFESTQFCSILEWRASKLFIIKKNVFININIKFQYCSTDHLNSLRESIFI